MKRFYIEDARCGLSRGAQKPPMPFAVCAAVDFREDDGESRLFFLNEFNGMPMFFISEEDFFDKILAEDGEVIGKTGKLILQEFEGIRFGKMKYDFESLAENEGNPAAALIRYLIALVRSDRDKTAGLIEMAKGRYLDELEIPVSDLEQKYLEERGEK